VLIFKHTDVHVHMYTYKPHSMLENRKQNKSYINSVPLFSLVAKAERYETYITLQKGPSFPFSWTTCLCFWCGKMHSRCLLCH